MDEQKPKSMIEIIKEAGYVMVVRCKDCIYGDVPKLSYRKDDIYCAKYEIFHNRDFYCADGERKEGDGE